MKQREEGDVRHDAVRGRIIDDDDLEQVAPKPCEERWKVLIEIIPSVIDRHDGGVAGKTVVLWHHGDLRIVLVRGVRL